MTSYITLLSYLPFALVAYALLWTAYTRLLHPLKHVTGPFWASVTQLWMIRHVMRGDMDVVQRSLHQRHGPLIRISPNEVACADPDAIRKIYPMSRPLNKSSFYTIWYNKALSKYPDNFSNTNERLHSERRRIVNNVYSMSTVLSLEPYIDNCSALFVKRMGEFADSGAVVDLGDWLQWYAFDVIGELFFGQQFGFMDNSHDHESYIASLDTLMPVLVAAGLGSPVLRGLILGSSMFSSTVRKGLKAVDHITAAARGCVAERSSIDTKGEAQANRKDSTVDTKGEAQANRKDLLHHLLEIAKNKGEAVDFGKGEVDFAGTDTTAIAMRSVFYHLMKNPQAYTELLKEIDDATSSGKLSSPPKFREASDLPLLCASIKEAMRLHPSVGLTMPRVTPVGGLEVAGTVIPAGYNIGMDAAVVGFNEDIFGSDVDKFEPERWLGENAATLDKHNLIFGAGTRTCIGKNISLSEIHKLVPLVLQNFELRLESPTESWKTHDFWFNKQTGIRVRVHRRR